MCELYEGGTTVTAVAPFRQDEGDSFKWSLVGSPGREVRSNKMKLLSTNYLVTAQTLDQERWRCYSLENQGPFSNDGDHLLYRPFDPIILHPRFRNPLERALRFL